MCQIDDHSYCSIKKAKVAKFRTLCVCCNSLKYVLNKCITKDESKRQISIEGENFMDDPTVTADQPVHYNFEHLEDNVLDCMVSQDIVRVW